MKVWEKIFNAIKKDSSESNKIDKLIKIAYEIGYYSGREDTTLILKGKNNYEYILAKENYNLMLEKYTKEEIEEG